MKKKAGHKVGKAIRISGYQVAGEQGIRRPRSGEWMLDARCWMVVGN